jgi:hypothetical protein
MNKMTASLRDNTKNNQERNKVRNKVRQGSKDIAKMFINTIEVNSPYLGKEAHILFFSAIIAIPKREQNARIFISL